MISVTSVINKIGLIICDMSPYIISIFSGAAIAIFAEPVRRFFFKPKLNLEFTGKEDCLSKTIEARNGAKVADAFYIKLKVTNTSSIIAKDCRAYLINIEKQNEDSKFGPTIYSDSIQLAWSCQGAMDRWRGIDICKGVNQYVDVITTRTNSEEFDPQIMCKPFRYLPLFKETGKFIFTIQVSADGADPKKYKLEFDWKGIWDKFAAVKLK